MQWINFLHLYQPANTTDYVIREATEKSYLRIVRALEQHPQIKFTLNVNGCLLLRWAELGYDEIIVRIKKLAGAGRIELVGSAAFHPILPLIPESEIIKQVKENESILKKNFGTDLKLAGFFMPEMAYSPEAAKIIAGLGYRWLILDQIAYQGQLEVDPPQPVYLDRASGLKIILRSRKFSNSYVPTTIAKLLKLKMPPASAITATDGELYGLRHIDPTAEFEKLLKSGNLTALTVTEFIDSQPVPEAVTIPSHNWETTEKDLANNQPFILWKEKNNTIQRKQWQLAELALTTLERYNKDKNYQWARWHLVRGLQSCTFWWSSARDFSRQFGPLSWGPDEIERGTDDLIRSIRSLENEATREIKLEAEKLYTAIIKMVWQKHWAYYWKKT